MSLSEISSGFPINCPNRIIRKWVLLCLRNFLLSKYTWEKKKCSQDRSKTKKKYLTNQGKVDKETLFPILYHLISLGIFTGNLLLLAILPYMYYRFKAWEIDKRVSPTSNHVLCACCLSRVRFLKYLSVDSLPSITQYLCLTVSLRGEKEKCWTGTQQSPSKVSPY